MKMKINYTKSTQYLCAVILIVTSIILAYIQVIDMANIANGTLMYIAQAFLLAGSIFGLDYYVKKLGNEYGNKENPKGYQEQQPAERSRRQQLAG